MPTWPGESQGWRKSWFCSSNGAPTFCQAVPQALPTHVPPVSSEREEFLQPSADQHMRIRVTEPLPPAHRSQPGRRQLKHLTPRGYQQGGHPQDQLLQREPATHLSTWPLRGRSSPCPGGEGRQGKEAIPAIFFAPVQRNVSSRKA